MLSEEIAVEAKEAYESIKSTSYMKIRSHVKKFGVISANSLHRRTVGDTVTSSLRQIFQI